MKKTKKSIAKIGKILLVFGVIFSQLSFPLSVLADELAIDSTMDMIDELSENIEEEVEDTDGEIIEEQTTNNQEIEEIPNEEEQLPEETKFTVEIVENEMQNLYIIRNELDTTITVKQLKEADSTVTTIINEEQVEVTDETTEIKSGYQITITAEELSPKTYTIIMLGDYDEDGMVTLKDKEVLLEILKVSSEEEINSNMVLLDLNEDAKFDILDVTHSVFTNGIWENSHVATDNLENYLMASAEEVYVDEEIEINYFIEGFEVDSLSGIQGKLNYDTSLLELTKIKVNDVEEAVLELENNSFAYLLENYNQDGIVITLTFKSLAVGAPVVSIEDIVASFNGVKANLDVDKVTTTFNNLEYGKGGNEEAETIIPTTPSTSEPTTITPTPVVVQTATQHVSLSTDNYIKLLTIKGYEIDFNQYTYEYSIKVKNDVSALELSVLLNSNKAIYYVEGNENFKVGENIVNIVVKAENGSTKTYTIKVEKEKKETIKDKKTKEKEDESEETNNSSKTIIIILIVLVIIGLIYVIFKDDEEEKKENSIKEIKKKEPEKNIKKENKNTNKKANNKRK